MTRPAFHWLLACLLTAAPAAGEPAASDPLEPFTRGVALQERGELDAAAAAYHEFLAAHPKNIQARSNLGVVLARLGRFAEAIAEYRSALAIDPPNTAIRLNLGIALYKSGNFADAAAELATLLRAQPDHRQARYLLADCHLRLGALDRVIALLEPDEATRPDDLALAYMLGMAYLRSGQAERGQQLVDRILRNGDSAEARLMMGMAKRAAHDLVGAQEDLAKAAALNSALPGVHSMYGMALLEAGNRDRAREEFEAELRSNANDFDAHLYLGVILKEDAAFERALDHVTRALELRPGDFGARFQIAAIKVATGRTIEAQPLLEAVVAEAPEFVEAHVLLATVYYRLRQREAGDRQRAIVEALTQKRQAMESNPPAPQTTGRQ